MNINDVREGEMVVSRDSHGLIVGRVVLIDREKDLISVRASSTETKNYHAREIHSVNFLLDYFLNRRGDGSSNSFRENNNNEKRLKGVIRALLEGKISEPIQKEILRELENIPEVNGQDAIAAL